ncbi:MAG: vacuolar transporter [Chloroflexi bacterium HGW-Chloroflexi-3]|nr:MAG: vacuolar transporter [Chloroflexi bacterium HGW-Chloroflexi-3]
MTTLSHTIRYFNRFELKYLITMKKAEEIRKTLHDYLQPDEHGNGNGHYSITSLYYDSPDYRCYWEKMDGVRYRRKLRIRNYDSNGEVTADSPVFVEIKQRIDRVTQKRRIILPYNDAITLCNLRQLPAELSNKDNEIYKEIQSFTWHYNLRPVSIVHYQRQAFVGGDFDLGLRITFDTNMVSQTYPLRINDLTQTSLMFNPDQVIMEIKVNERIPYWLTEMVASYNLRMVRVSKYCRSIDPSNVFPAFSANYLRSVI